MPHPVILLDATTGVTVEIPGFIVAAVQRVSGEQRLPLALANAVRHWLSTGCH